MNFDIQTNYYDSMSVTRTKLGRPRKPGAAVIKPIEVKAQVDRSQYCPFCNQKVHCGDADAICVDGQMYHLHHFFTPGARTNGCEEYFAKFEARHKTLLNIPLKTQPEKIEFKKLDELLKSCSKN